MSHEILTSPHQLFLQYLTTVVRSHEFESNSDGKRKKLRGSAYEEVDSAVMLWFNKVRREDIPLSGPLVMEKANEFAAKLGVLSFKANTGWLDRFKKRHNISWRVISGESDSVDPLTIESWKPVLSSLIESYDEKNIFNADETGLFYRLLPDKMLSVKGETCNGGKKSKERLTVLLASNMDGSEKLRPLVVGKSKNPRCFKNVKSLPCDYDANKKAWITSVIFSTWILKLEKKMKAEKRKIILFLDNFSAHQVNVKLEHVKVQFLPKNTTSKLQPLDQGIIKNAKVHYRKRVIRRLLDNLESTGELPIINVKDAIDYIHFAWEHVQPSVIANCFHKAGFFKEKERVLEDSAIGTTSEEVTDTLIEVISEEWNELATQMGIPSAITPEDYISSDDCLFICEEVTDEMIVDTVKGSDKVESEDDLEELPESFIHLPSRIEAIMSIEKLRKFIEGQPNIPSNIFKALSELDSFLIYKCTSSSRQTQIDDFFKNSSV